MIEIIPAQIDGVRIVRPMVQADPRGTFVKFVHERIFSEHGLPTRFAEQYYSVSSQNVLRGLHLQVPPHHHDKLVTCIAGEVFDVVVDLRKGRGYGRHQSFDLDGARGDSIFVPAGCAHGFYVRSATAIVLYNVGTVHAPLHDTGIRWDSAGIAWPSAAPVVSDRDAALAPLAEFSSPFG
jgi:dTDP-4-dehydrorhamnose 3,5-epimerase